MATEPKHDRISLPSNVTPFAAVLPGISSNRNTAARQRDVYRGAASGQGSGQGPGPGVGNSGSGGLDGVQRRSALSSSPSPSTPPLLALLHPRHFAPEFDLISEITYNRGIYAGNESISIYSFPAYLRTCIDRVRAVSDTEPVPSFSLVISACIANGLEIMKSHDAIVALCQLQLLLLRNLDIDMDDLEELNFWFRSFAVSVVDLLGVGSRRQNINIPPDLANSVHSFSSDMGMSISVVVTLSVMMTLCTQNDAVVTPQYKTLLDSAVERFYSKATLRARVARALMAELVVVRK